MLTKYSFLGFSMKDFKYPFLFDSKTPYSMGCSLFFAPIEKRDLFLIALSTQVNTNRELIKLSASPVPFIWLARIITNYFLIEISYPEFPTTNELIEKLSKNCDNSRFITAPKNLLDFNLN